MIEVDDEVEEQCINEIINILQNKNSSTYNRKEEIYEDINNELQ